jgi:tetratricopeptide (TPR) repeat protein
MYGDYLLREGELRKARDRFASAVELDAGRQLIWLQLCELDAQLGDWGLLVEHAKEARNMFPSQPAFYLLLAIGQLRTDNMAGAIDNLTVGKSYVVDDAQLLTNFWSTLGEAHYEAGNWKKSDEAFEKALSFSPDDPFIMNNYSYFLAVRGRKLDRAAELSLRSNQIMPGSASFQDTYGWVLFRKGKYDEALEWIGKALASGAEDGVVLEHYGDILFHLNRVDEAVTYWKRASSAGGASELIDNKVADRTYYDDLKP